LQRSIASARKFRVPQKLNGEKIITTKNRYHFLIDLGLQALVAGNHERSCGRISSTHTGGAGIQRNIAGDAAG
jgi:hypothetical protein